jgi:translocation and assembly module TamA
MVATRMASLAGKGNTVWFSEQLRQKWGRGLALFSAAALLFVSTHGQAQEQQTDAELEQLIPDAAVADPEAWSNSPPAAPAPTPSQTPQQLEPASQERSLPAPEADSPLASDSSFRLPWPDAQFELPAVLALEPDPDLAASLAAQPEALPAVRDGGEVVSVAPELSLAFLGNVSSFPDRDKFVARFAELSAIKRLSGEGENSVSQLAARARTDSDLLRRLLRINGFYNASVEQTISGIETGQGSAANTAKLLIRFDVNPGPLYRFDKIGLGDLAATGNDFPALRQAFSIQTGDPIDQDRITEAQGELKVALGDSGYAFAKLGEPDLQIDHSRETGDLNIPLVNGGVYTYGKVTSNLPDFLPAGHLARMARFKPGQLFKRSQLEDLRRAIIATGLVSSVSITPRAEVQPSSSATGEVALDIAMAKAPLRTIAGAVGYDSGEGFRVEASWEHRNLFPPEGLLRFRGVAGTKEQLAGVTFRRSNFRGRDQVLTVDLYASAVTRDAYVARTAAFSASFEKLTTLIFQKPWVWSVGLEALASREREGDVDGVGSPPQNYYILALPLRGALDTSDNLLDPTKGFRAALRVSPEFSFDQGRKANYARMQADASAYLPLGRSAVLAGRMRFGSITGTGIQNIAPSRRFYAGGGGSVRGFGFQQIGPRNSFNAPSGGRSLSEFSLEARINTSLFGNSLSIVPFVDAGTVSESVTPRLGGMLFGAGIGLRYKTGFGPIRIDVGTPINKRPEDSRVAVYVSLGQAF